MNGWCLAPPTLSGRPCWLCLLWALLFVFVFVGAGKGEGLFVFAWILFSELFVLGTLPPSRQIGWGGATQPHTLLSLVPCLLAAPPGCHVNKRPAFLEALGTSWLPQIGSHWPVLLHLGFPGPWLLLHQLLLTWGTGRAPFQLAEARCRLSCTLEMRELKPGAAGLGSHPAPRRQRQDHTQFRTVWTRVNSRANLDNLMKYCLKVKSRYGFSIQSSGRASQLGRLLVFCMLSVLCAGGEVM